MKIIALMDSFIMYTVVPYSVGGLVNTCARYMKIVLLIWGPRENPAIQLIQWNISIKDAFKLYTANYK